MVGQKVVPESFIQLLVMFVTMAVQHPVMLLAGLRNWCVFVFVYLTEVDHWQEEGYYSKFREGLY